MGNSVLAHALKFLFFSGVLLLVAWIAGTGRVAYMMIMLLVAAALGFAVLDSIGYEVAKKDRRG
jgi:RsiW-degrading membrane proteinase PrsW (M82 family)